MASFSGCARSCLPAPQHRGTLPKAEIQDPSSRLWSFPGSPRLRLGSLFEEKFVKQAPCPWSPSGGCGLTGWGTQYLDLKFIWLSHGSQCGHKGVTRPQADPPGFRAAIKWAHVCLFQVPAFGDLPFSWALHGLESSRELLPVCWTALPSGCCCLPLAGDMSHIIHHRVPTPLQWGSLDASHVELYIQMGDLLVCVFCICKFVYLLKSVCISLISTF